MQLQPKSFEEPESMFCRGYRQRMSIFTCMSNFVDANALKQKTRPCFNCMQGTEIRLGYAKS